MPDVSNRKRKPNGEFDNEDKEQKPSAGATGMPYDDFDPDATPWESNWAEDPESEEYAEMSIELSGYGYNAGPLPLPFPLRHDELERKAKAGTLTYREYVAACENGDPHDERTLIDAPQTIRDNYQTLLAHKEGDLERLSKELKPDDETIRRVALNSRSAADGRFGIQRFHDDRQLMKQFALYSPNDETRRHAFREYYSGRPGAEMASGYCRWSGNEFVDGEMGSLRNGMFRRWRNSDSPNRKAISGTILLQSIKSKLKRDSPDRPQQERDAAAELLVEWCDETDWKA